MPIFRKLLKENSDLIKKVKKLSRKQLRSMTKEEENQKKLGEYFQLTKVSPNF